MIKLRPILEQRNYFKESSVVILELAVIFLNQFVVIIISLILIHSQIMMIFELRFDPDGFFVGQPIVFTIKFIVMKHFHYEVIWWLLALIIVINFLQKMRLVIMSFSYFVIKW